MAAIFDLLFSQCDRHGQNVYLKPDGSLVLIDNDQVRSTYPSLVLGCWGGVLFATPSQCPHGPGAYRACSLEGSTLSFSSSLELLTAAL